MSVIKKLQFSSLLLFGSAAVIFQFPSTGISQLIRRNNIMNVKLSFRYLSAATKSVYFLQPQLQNCLKHKKHIQNYDLMKFVK